MVFVKAGIRFKTDPLLPQRLKNKKIEKKKKVMLYVKLSSCGSYFKNRKLVSIGGKVLSQDFRVKFTLLNQKIAYSKPRHAQFLFG